MAGTGCFLHQNKVRSNMLIFCVLYMTLHLVMANVPTYHVSDYCSNPLDMTAGKVNAGRLLLRRPQQGIQTMDCHMLIKAPANKMLTFKFQHFDIKSPHGCNNNYIQIFGDTRRELPLTEKLCNTNMPDRAFVTSGDDAIVQVMKDHFQGDEIELIFTAFRFSPCASGEYHCENGHCIAKELYCNGFDNCGDRSDICLIRKETVIAIVVGAAAIVVISMVVLTVCLIRRQRKIRRERVSG